MSRNTTGGCHPVNITDCFDFGDSITNHGDPNLFCRPSKWTDVAVFLLGNYVAHVATIHSSPGQSVLETILFSFTALFFPSAGVFKAFQAITSRAIFADTELQRATRAGALFVVQKIRTESSRPRDEENNVNPERKTPLQKILHKRMLRYLSSDSGRKKQNVAGSDEAIEAPEVTSIEPPPILALNIHGLCRLPKGYVLRCLPKDSTFENDDIDDQPKPSFSRSSNLLWASFIGYFRSSRPDPNPRTSLSCSYNIVKIVVSILQLIFACSTLYRTKGDQIEIFGYAAFGLTVAMYAWKSFLNLIGSLICPQYPSCFLVASKTSEDLKQRLKDRQDLFLFDGLVGKIDERTEDLLKSIKPKAEDYILREAYHWNRSFYQSAERSVHSTTTGWDEPQNGFQPNMGKHVILSAYNIVVPIAIIGAMSHFAPNSSSLYQRVWTMTWLTMSYMGPFIILFAHMALLKVRSWDSVREGNQPPPKGSVIGYLYTLCLYSVPAFGGFVVVSQMILSYGVCERI